MADKKPMKAVPPELTEALADINAATNEVAAKVEQLRSQVKQSMTPQEISDFNTGMRDISSRLRGIAVDPQDPAPEPPTP